MKDLQKFELGRGISLSVLPTDKFKTITISYCFHRDLDEDYTYNALIPAVLRRGCEGLESLREIEEYLEDKYGAIFDVGIQKKGERHILRFTMDIVNEDYVAPGSGLLSDAFEFMNAIITRPVTENGVFKKSYVDQEKENLKNRILSLVNDKIRYSLERCIQEMCRGEKYSRYVLGSVKDLEALDYNKLFGIYRDIIETSPLDIFVIGDVEPDRVRFLIENSLMIDRKYIKPVPETVVKKLQVTERIVTEEMDVSQGKLNMGFRTNTGFTERDYFPLVVYSNILGGGPHSKLFLNVREKASLAYYVFARLEKFKGLMLVAAGIDADKYQQTVDIIRQQMNDIKEGKITEDEFESAIKSIITAIREMKDHAGQLVDFYLGNSVGRCDLSPDEYIENIRNVSIEEIPKVAEKIKLDTIYFLRNPARGDV